ncbi:DNA polymerase epsilon catalytic subunit A, partial [Dissostichus eleginoides]
CDYNSSGGVRWDVSFPVSSLIVPPQFMACFTHNALLPVETKLKLKQPTEVYSGTREVSGWR